MKKFISIILIFTICLVCGGCYDSQEISRIAFVIAVGFDENSYSFQIVNPSAFEGEGSENSPLLTKTFSASNVYSAMDKLNAEIAEKCDYSHIKMVVFSRKLLEKGVEKEIDAMLKSNDFHPNTKTAMCEGKASDFLKDMKVPLDANPAEYYENIFKAGFTEFSPDTKLKDIQKNYNSHTSACVLPVINGDVGMAVAKNFKLNGTATANETLIYNLLSQKGFEGSFEVSEKTVVYLKKTHCKTSIILSGKQPVITVNILLEGNVIWSEDNAAKDKTEKLAEEKLKKEISDFLYKCSQQYKADILEFHKLAKKNYLTVDSWENEDWQGLFEKSSYSVSVDVNIKREGLNIN